MATPILVVDDSSMSRKRITKALPMDWDVEITYAANGREALDAYRAGRGHVMFLDLTMPDMDGYEVLQTLKHEGLDSFVIVCSADIQPQAQARVKELGAIGFVKKPVDPGDIKTILEEYRLL